MKKLIFVDAKKKNKKHEFAPVTDAADKIIKEASKAHAVIPVSVLKETSGGRNILVPSTDSLPPVPVNNLPDDGYFYQKCKFYEPLKKPSIWKIAARSKWKAAYGAKMKEPATAILIRMQISSGNWREFYAVEELGGFFYRKKMYIFDFKQRYYIIERETWAYDFHEWLTLPLKRKKEISEQTEKILARIYFLQKKEPNNRMLAELEREVEERLGKEMLAPVSAHYDIDEIKTMIETSGLIDVEDSLNPMVLERTVKSEAITQALRSLMVNRIFKIILILLIFMTVVTLLLLIITAWHSHLFEAMKNAFKKG